MTFKQQITKFQLLPKNTQLPHYKAGKQAEIIGSTTINYMHNRCPTQLMNFSRDSNSSICFSTLLENSIIFYLFKYIHTLQMNIKYQPSESP